MAVSQPAHPADGQRVRFLRVTEMRYRVALQAVGAALHDDELGRGFVDVSLNPVSGCLEFIIAGTGVASES